MNSPSIRERSTYHLAIAASVATIVAATIGIVAAFYTVNSDNHQPASLEQLERLGAISNSTESEHTDGAAEIVLYSPFGDNHGDRVDIVAPIGWAGRQV